MARILTTDEYLLTPRPQLNWLIDQQLPHPGTLLLLGPPKSGKSFLALDLLRCVAQGKSFLGWKTHKSKGLYLQFDTSELVWRERLEKMKASGVNLSGDIMTVHPDDMLLPINILNVQHQDWLTRVVASANPDVTVIDVFREIHNADENDSTSMKIAGDILMTIFKGRSLVIVHHSKKISDDVIDPDPTQVARGSSYLTGKVDSIWLLYHNKLRIQSRTAEPMTIPVKQSGSGSWIV